MAACNGSFRRLSLVVGLVLMIAVYATGCSGKKSKEDDGGVANASMDGGAGLGDSDSGKAFGLQTVRFPYDSSILDSDGKSTLTANAQVLKDKASLRIQVEGHCDARGGIQYNIALGEKRANAVKHYLTGMGVSKSRMTVISYGKERPINPAETEEAYAQNRRANFVVTAD